MVSSDECANHRKNRAFAELAATLVRKGIRPQTDFEGWREEDDLLFASTMTQTQKKQSLSPKKQPCDDSRVYALLDTPHGPLWAGRDSLGINRTSIAGADEAAPSWAPDYGGRNDADPLLALLQTRLRSLLVDLSGIPLHPRSSAFQRRVWRELYKVPPGRAVSYGFLARACGSAPRAIGNAMARNPLPVLIPCHRVVAANGHLHGFASGLERKADLLALEILFCQHYTKDARQNAPVPA